MSRYEEDSELTKKKPQWIIAGTGVMVFIVGMIIYGLMPENQILMISLVITGTLMMLVGMIFPRIIGLVTKKNE